MKKFKMLSLALITLFSLSLVSCGSWVDMPKMGMLGNKCSAKDIEKYKKSKNKAIAKMLFGSVCKKEGKEFADDIRCNDGKLQIKCK